MRRSVGGWLLLSVLMTWLVLPGCSSRTASSSGTSEVARVPESSKLAKIHEGMEREQVEDTLGRPDGKERYFTGKAFIPFYFGDDYWREEWRYKGLGRVVLSDGGAFGRRGGQVQWVEYDPGEKGTR